MQEARRLKKNNGSKRELLTKVTDANQDRRVEDPSSPWGPGNAWTSPCGVIGSCYHVVRVYLAQH